MFTVPMKQLSFPRLTKGKPHGGTWARRVNDGNLCKLLASFVWCAALVPGSAVAQLELKFGHSGDPGSLLAKSADEFASRANARLGTAAKVVVMGAGRLGGDSELLRKLRAGEVDLTLAGSVMSSEADLFGIFDMPYLVQDRRHMQAIEKEIVWPRLAPELERKGLKIIGVWENGYRHITSNKRPVRVPADLRGMKLRVPEGAWRVKMFRAYGTEARPMKFSEVYEALQTGAIDGQENPFTIIHSARLHEVQKFLSLTGHVYTPAYVTVNPGRWATLPATVRGLLENTAREVQSFVYATAENDEREVLDKLRAAGMQVNDVDKAAFVQASRAVYEQFGKEVPSSAELIEKALQLAR